VLEKGKIALQSDPGRDVETTLWSSAGPIGSMAARRRIVDPYGDGDRRTDAGRRTPISRERWRSRSTVSPTSASACVQPNDLIIDDRQLAARS
jgi:hypothetical protein